MGFDGIGWAAHTQRYAAKRPALRAPRRANQCRKLTVSSAAIPSYIVRASGAVIRDASISFVLGKREQAVNVLFEGLPSVSLLFSRLPATQRIERCTAKVLVVGVILIYVALGRRSIEIGRAHV